jgi:uncharacterized DUF497 family protein
MDDDVIYGDFVWNRKKNEINKAKHGIAFEKAIGIFNDPCLYEVYDQKNSEESGEHRVKYIGCLQGILVLVLSATDREEKTRILSARAADPKEERLYYAYIQEVFGN